MRKGTEEGSSGTIPFTMTSLEALKAKGYRFVQVKGFTIDNHYEYIEPYFLLLVPLKELPVSILNKDIYEPIESDILIGWAAENRDGLKIYIANDNFRLHTGRISPSDAIEDEAFGEA